MPTLPLPDAAASRMGRDTTAPGKLSRYRCGGLPALTALRRAHEILDYVTLAEERYREVQTYSTGMRQKIKLAQALIHSPKLVFLDEPTSGLDPTGRERVQTIRDILDFAYQPDSIETINRFLDDWEAAVAADPLPPNG